MDLLVYDDRDQRYVPMIVALCAALVVALIIGALAYFLGRNSPATAAEPASGVTAPQAGTSGTAVQGDAACAPALESAQEALEIAARLEGALKEQTSAMDDLLAKRVTREQALDRALPPLTTASKDRQAFLAAVTTYERARASCQQ